MKIVFLNRFQQIQNQNSGFMRNFEQGEVQEKYFSFGAIKWEKKELCG